MILCQFQCFILIFTNTPGYNVKLPLEFYAFDWISYNIVKQQYG